MPMKAGPGRPKGLKNKLPTELRARMMAIAEQLEADGKGLDVEAGKDPRWFYETFIRPLLPKEVKAEMNGDIRFEGVVRIVRGDGQG